MDFDEFVEKAELYDNIAKDPIQIVDGISIESMDTNSKKQGQVISKAKTYLRKEEKKSKKSKSEQYLSEITELLDELKDLDKMLALTSKQTIMEKDKKRKNQEINAKMKKIEGLMQK